MTRLSIVMYILALENCRRELKNEPNNKGATPKYVLSWMKQLCQPGFLLQKVTGQIAQEPSILSKNQKINLCFQNVGRVKTLAFRRVL